MLSQSWAPGPKINGEGWTRMDIHCKIFPKSIHGTQNKPRKIGEGCKLFSNHNLDWMGNDVGLILKEENVLEVKRVSDEVMSMKIETGRVMMNAH